MATDQNGTKSSGISVLETATSLPTIADSIASNSTTSFPTLSSSEEESTTSSLTTTVVNDQPPEANQLPPSGHYSGRHRVPRIESYWELYPDRSTTGASQKPEDKKAERKERKRKVKEHSEVVIDPITGKIITICDARYKPPQPAPLSAQPVYPHAQWSLFFGQLRSLTLKYVAFVAASFVFLNGGLGLPFSVSIVVTIAGGVTWWRSVDSAWENFCHFVESDQGKQRMRIPGIRGNESVEWLNGILTKLWPQVNTDLFVPIVDLLEDVMQASIPSFITQVKIVNVGQGVTPLRILSMRWLDEENENDSKASDTKDGATDRLNEEEQMGEWASLEVSFAYRAQPSSSSAQSKAKNANLLVHFFMGLNGFFGAPLPVWVELRGATGTCRMKIQLIPDPPFVKLGTFTLLGMPKIEVAAVPMNQRFFNVMNLPIVSDFIYSSIRAAAKRFVAPSNYTLDLAKILVGDDTKKELFAIGVLVVNIHSAIGVMAADVNGKSDCYATLSYSKCRKPIWSSRIIFEELNPVWDETAVLLLDSSEVKAAEGLSLQLYDSDRFTADDMLGRTEIDVARLICSPGKVWEREDNLMGMKEGSTMPGTVKWSVVYYGNRGLNKSLQTKVTDEKLPQDSEHPQPDLPKRKRRGTDPAVIPPDPDYPSGILAIQVHNIIGLERHILTGSKGSSGIRRGEAQTTQEEEEGHNLPSAYVTIILDYQTIYRTRTKPMTSKPFFNAGTERFVRDWTKTKLSVVVRDSRLREEDPILGVVDLTLKDVLTEGSQLSRFYPIRGGIGYGKIRISLLFRSIDVQLPKAILGADIGSIEIVSHKVSSASITDPEVQKADIIKFATPLIRKDAVRVSDSTGWKPKQNTKGSTGFRLGVRHRHSAPCILYFRRDSKIRRDKTLAVAVFWLKDLPDDEIVHLTLPVFRPENIQRFVQNCGVGDGTGVGFVEIEVRFHRGLGHSHRRAAVAEKDFRDVIEATACVEHIRGEASDNEASPSEDEEKSSTPRPSTPAAPATRPSSRGTFGAIGELKGKLSKKREDTKELHRMERGAMQWKGVRTLAWMGEGIKEKGREVRGALKMEPKRPGVETEA